MKTSDLDQRLFDPVDVTPPAAADRRPVLKHFVRRKELQMTLEDEEKICRVGADYLSLLEKQRFIPDANQLRRIAAALRMDVDDVLKEIDISAK